MNATAKTSLEDILNELRVAEKDKPLDGFQRGELKRLFEHLEQKYNIPFNTVRNTYYKEVRNKVNRFEAQPIQQLRNTPMTPKPSGFSYRIGQIVKVKITNVLEYGAFAETLDGKYSEGLIHISEIRNEYIDDIHHHFKVGDIVEAKIKKITSNQKIEFSTKDLNIMIEKEERPLNENSFVEITNFLNGIVGALSPKAKNKLKDMIQEHGAVKFTIAMMQAGKSFENDLGLVLLEQIEKRIEDCL